MNAHLLGVARAYHEANAENLRLPAWSDSPATITLDRDAGRLAGAAFHVLPHDPKNPEVKEAYDALKRETLAQYQHAVAHGYKFEPWRSEGQPYADSKEMRDDVLKNKHLWYFPTDAGFGTDSQIVDHPLYSEASPGVRYNDLFRAVHDLYAHAIHGHQFGPQGELRAWVEHARMFSPLARKALTTETHGQNSWVNFGPHEPWKLPVTERPYADQKAAILPASVYPKVKLAKKRGPESVIPPSARHADEQAFHDQIRDNGPAADHDRLVYADMLQDRGENESAARIRWWSEARKHLLANRYKSPKSSLIESAHQINQQPAWVRALVLVHHEREAHDPEDWGAQDPTAIAARSQGLHAAEMHAYGVVPSPHVDFTHAVNARLAERAGNLIGGGSNLLGSAERTRQREMHDNYAEYAAHDRVRNALEREPQVSNLEGRPAAHLLDFIKKNPPPDATTATKMSRVKLARTDALLAHERAVLANPADDTGWLSLADHHQDEGDEGLAQHIRKYVEQRKTHPFLSHPNRGDMLATAYTRKSNSLTSADFTFDPLLAGAYTQGHFTPGGPFGTPGAHVPGLPESFFPKRVHVKLLASGHPLPVVDEPTRNARPTEHDRVAEDVRSYRQIVRSKMPHSMHAILNTPAEHPLMHAWFVKRGLKVVKSPYTYYDDTSHTLYHENPEDKSAVVKAYLQSARAPVKLSREHFPSNFSYYWLDPTGQAHDIGNMFHQKWMMKTHGIEQEAAMDAGWHKITVMPQDEVHVYGHKPLSALQKDAVGQLALNHRTYNAKHLIKGNLNSLPIKLARNEMKQPGAGAANRMMGSSNHRARVELAKTILAEAGLTDARVKAVLAQTGKQGIRPAVSAILSSANPRVAKYAAAWIGMMTGQPHTTVFHPGAGEDTLHIVDSPHPDAHVGEYLARAGVPQFTIEPKGSGSRAFVVNPMDLIDVETAARGLQGTVSKIPGTAIRLGANSGKDARAAYRQIIDDAEKEATSGQA